MCGSRLRSGEVPSVFIVPPSLRAGVALAAGPAVAAAPAAVGATDAGAAVGALGAEVVAQPASPRLTTPAAAPCSARRRERRRGIPHPPKSFRLTVTLLP